MLRLLLGLAAHVPVLNGMLVNRGTGGTNLPEYCYGVWLKHLTLLNASGYAGVPDSVAELGPGDSLGVGLAALLSGASSYRALDVKRFTNDARNERVLDALVESLRQRAARPRKGWPDFDEHLDSELFPAHILDPASLERALAPERVEAIRTALGEGRSRDGSITIEYCAPWESVEAVERGSIDVILSHSVLEHVRELPATYAACASWLRPGGWMSHQIDFKSHGLAREWNGCWAHGSGLGWELLAGKRDCWINRQPYSRHVAEIEAAGFELVTNLAYRREDGIARSALAPTWRDLSDTDLRTAGCFVQARKLQTSS